MYLLDYMANRVLDTTQRCVYSLDMNMDERLEALTHSVELLAAMQEANEKQLQRLEKLTIDIAEGTARLLVVAESHEQRISDLESRR